MIQNAFIVFYRVLFCDILSIPIQMLYPFGAQYGDSGLGRGDDMTSAAIQISMSFPFFNNSHDYLFVSIIFEIVKKKSCFNWLYIMGKNLNSDGQQFHQYRQNEQSPITYVHLGPSWL